MLRYLTTLDSAVRKCKAVFAYTKWQALTYSSRQEMHHFDGVGVDALSMRPSRQGKYIKKPRSERNIQTMDGDNESTMVCDVSPNPDT